MQCRASFGSSCHDDSLLPRPLLFPLVSSLPLAHLYSKYAGISCLKYTIFFILLFFQALHIPFSLISLSIYKYTILALIIIYDLFYFQIRSAQNTYINRHVNTIRYICILLSSHKFTIVTLINM